MRNMFTLLVVGVFLVCVASPLFAADVKPLEYNKERLVIQAAVGEIAAPRLGDPPYRIGADGILRVLPGTGSITYNFRSGDTAINLAADHVEPAVTLYNPGTEGGRESSESRGLNTLACIGNKVTIITGDGKGEVGFVIGKHGGSEHVMVDFRDVSVFDKLIIGDKMQVRTHGVGLELKNIEGVHAMNLSPYLLDALTDAGMGVTDEGKLRIPIAVKVPAKVMGSGLGRNHVYRGDYDIQLFDDKTVQEYGLDKLRFGDLV
jgi:hypothetical protein